MNDPSKPRPRVPVSTYRLQFRPDFGFADAAALAPQLARLGVTDLYLSPCFQASPHSPHGYDLTDHNRLSEDLGGEAGWAAFTSALAGLDMGAILDFVPNHMGVDDPRSNPWWWDVLENGNCSPYARFFDIDWDPVKPELRGKLLLPVLGDQYGRVLERGELRLEYTGGALCLRYFERTFPINPRRAPIVLRHDLAELEAQLGESDANLREFLSVLTSLGNLPSVLETDRERVAERQREKEIARARLERLTGHSGAIREHVERSVAAFNGQPGDRASFAALHDLLELQAYRLAYWRTAFHEINYRRFFDVNGLASLRMEDPEVFAMAHRRLLRMVADRQVTGIRLDHIDGLFDPRAYLDQLAGALRAALDAPDGGEPPATGTPGLPAYVVVEKILSPGERLPESWATHGTTGYEFLNQLNGLFVDPLGNRPLAQTFRGFTRRRGSFEDTVYTSKKIVMESTLASELNMLARALNVVSEHDPYARDFTLNSLHDMLLEVVACFPVYRTYVARDASSEDARLIHDAIARAIDRNPGIDVSIFAFFENVALDPDGGALPESEHRRRREFMMRLQQYTGTVQAKGVEDTSFYRHHALLSLNEVGGSPQRFAVSPAEFHALNRERQERWPWAMLSTSTHDTKRGEDARVRLNVLSEIPGEWRREVTRWSHLNAANRTRLGRGWSPDRGDEYLFYQALLGAWPAVGADLGALSSRLRDYMLKAIRESKLHTSWIQENPDYERATANFVEQCLTGRRARAFLDSFEPLAMRVARCGAVQSLAQLVLKLASPGVPD
ncbi:MAG: malto-oligosyltrehalose synthase, partial [Candidatus Eisenbacteria bacterium]